MSKRTVGYINGELLLDIGYPEPVFLSHLTLPITVDGSSDYATYAMNVDLASVAQTVRNIFEEAEKEQAGSS